MYVVMRGLLLEELFCGALVRRVLSPSCVDGPWRVVSLSCDGTLFLSSLCGGDSVRSHIAEVCGVGMDGVLLSSLGFVRSHKERVWYAGIDGIRLVVSLRQRHGEESCRRIAVSGKVSCWNEHVRYVHELQRWWVEKVHLPYGVGLSFPLSVDLSSSVPYED